LSAVRTSVRGMNLVELVLQPMSVETWRLGESELVAATTGLSQRIRELEALRVRMVADLDSRGTAKAVGASSTAAWLSGVTPDEPGGGRADRAPGQGAGNASGYG